jgi:hypothetical protein
MAEVQPADPGARRLALVLVVLGFVVGALLLWALNAGGPAIARWLREDPAAMVMRARMLLLAVAIVMAGPPIAAGAYLWSFGTRVVRSNRFPPPGARLVQDMLVLNGDVARSRGRIAQGAGLVLVLAGSTMAVLLWRLAGSIAAGGG